MNFDFDDGVIVIGDGSVAVDGDMVSGSRQWVRDPRLHHPTDRMVEAEFRRALRDTVFVPLPTGMKWCYSCGRVKMLVEFAPRRRGSRDGRDARCHECDAARKRSAYAREVEAAGRAVRAYTRRNVEER